MKYVFLFLMVIAGLVTVLGLPHAYSDFSTNNKYIVQASGYLSGNQTIFDSSMALQLTMGTKSGSTMQSTLDNGLVQISNSPYLNSGIWQTSILRDGKYFVIKGDAEDQNGNTIHLNLFGRIIDSNQDGSVYVVTGKIVGYETMKVSYSAKIISVNTIPTKPTTIPTTQTTPEQQPSSNQVGISIVYGASDQNTQVHFTPSNIQVAPGTTITWTNNDFVPHRIMSGIAKATTIDQSVPIFASDGKFDSGEIAPGKTFQFTVTDFDATSMLDPKVAQRYNIPEDQRVGDISFFDPTYPFMVGIIAPLIPPSTAQGTVVQMNIVSGASDPNNGKFLSPSSILITSGSTIEIVNNDSVPHLIKSGKLISTYGSGPNTLDPSKQPQFTPDDILNTGTIAPGQHYRVAVTKVGTIQIFDPSFTWINGIVVSSTTTSTTPISPVQISILPGSSSKIGSAVQQQFNQYNTYYDPETIQIAPGTPIIWVNNDSIEHTILSGTSTQQYATNPFIPDGKIASGKIAPGQTFTAIINDTGIIRFYDPQYTWMNGVVISMNPTPSYNKITGQQSLHTH